MSIVKVCHDDCCGCTTCQAVCKHDAISMLPDSEGFSYPIVDEKKCMECGLCETVCPVLKPVSIGEKPLKIFAAYSQDETVVKRSTSGGIFHHLAEWTIRQGGVVCGVVYDEEFQVKHVLAETMEEVARMHGAKYVQSTIDDGLLVKIRSYLRQSRWVLFSGTPCQVAGVRNMMNSGREHLLLCDVVCRSVSSPMIYGEYLKFAQRNDRLSRINMRAKTYGWDKTAFRLEYKNGKCIEGKGDAQLWHDIHFSGMVSRPSCASCRYSNMVRVGDITLGDFWGIKRSHPAFFHQEGVSLIMVNSDKGHAVLKDIFPDLVALESTSQLCRQPALCSPAPRSPRRQAFWADFEKMTFEKLAVKYFDYGWLNQSRKKMKRWVKKMLGRK